MFEKLQKVLIFKMMKKLAYEEQRYKWLYNNVDSGYKKRDRVANCFRMVLNQSDSKSDYFISYHLDIC